MTTAAIAGGRTDGITRVVREIAKFGLTRADTELVVLADRRSQLYEIDRSWSAAILDGTTILDLPRLDVALIGSPLRLSQRFKQGMPRWLRHPRRAAYVLLDAWSSAPGRFSRLAAGAQKLLMNERYRLELTGRGGISRRLVSLSKVSTRSVSLSPQDVFLICGSDWPAIYDFLRRRTQGVEGRIAVLCYDTIPLLYPQFFLPGTAAMFKRCFEEIIRVADLLIFTAEAVRKDTLTHFADKLSATQRTCVVSLGTANARPDPAGQHASLRKGLEPFRYILFVSTFEPRKGHGMLLSVWKRLITVPSVTHSGFKMVFVGRKGWLVDDLFERFATEPCVGDSLLLVSDAADDEVNSLYENAAFCVYPSIYEGFGLPIVESFRHGKAVISSNGGALPEVVSDLSPCIDPRDEDAWFEILRLWIEDPAERANCEAAIRARFRPRPWEETGREMFAALENKLGGIGQHAQDGG